jgi:hypothetical protein
MYFTTLNHLQLTICIVGAYMILDTDRIKKGTFRGLVIALFASFGYDVFWLLVSSSSYNANDSADGGVEKSIRKFSLYMSVISFFFRVRLLL